MNMYPRNTETLALNLFVGGNSPDAKPESGTHCVRYSRRGASTRPRFANGYIVSPLAAF